ncbi:YgcG family protein [Pseudomonas sp. WS 5412]|uniref:TPM domain-containing protein n=1 Tax=Pseudomonas TaxID=286 RepID=UPI001473D97E|nr:MULTISPECIES: YgcG family protein [Pseudomonas]MDD1131816.1 YgcG family protein [Pseudomonas shahriarae]NMY34946.1 YgcG family protein [Pseudomonas sp. WS 5412]
MGQFIRQSVLGLLVMVFTTLAVAQTAPPALENVPLNQRVIDLTHTLDTSTQQRLTEQLADLEQRKGAQIAVMLLPTTGDADLETFTTQLFRAWKLGRKGIDDGILLLVVKDDRTVRIEVGYGLEGVVTDLLSHRIIEEQLNPAFRQGDYAGGVQRAVDALTVLVEGGDLPAVDQTRETVDETAVLLALILGVVGGVLLASGKLHWRRGLIAGLVLTVLLTALAAINGKAWPIYVLALPFCMSISAALFGALWQAKAVFYCVVGLMAYSIGLGLVDHYLTEVSFMNWLAWPLAALVVLGLYLILFAVMKAAWKHSRLGFCVQSVMVLGVYGAAGYMLEMGLDGWLFAWPISSFAALFIYGQGTGGSSSGSSDRSSSSSSSSSSSGGGFSGGGGSSGGGGASGSW